VTGAGFGGVAGFGSRPGKPHFGGVAGFGARPAVLAVDMSVGFTDPSSPLACDLHAVIGATRELLDVARAAAVPIFFTSVVYDEAGREAAAVFLRKVPALGILEPGSRWVEIEPRLGRRDGEPVVEKAFASAFFATPLAALLAGRDTVVVCGASTSGCVRATVVDALQHGFAPIVPRECVGDRSAAAHAQALEDIGGRYGDVVDLREAAGAVQQAGELAAERG
jgi:maleamate amidohydrolase